MRTTRESGKGFQTEKEGKSKLGQIFCKEQDNEKCECVTMREQRVFSPGRLQGQERQTTDLLVEGTGRERAEGAGHVTHLVSSAGNPWRQKLDGTSWVFEEWEPGLGCLGEEKQKMRAASEHRNLTGSCGFHYQYSVMC